MLLLFVISQALCRFEGNAYKTMSESWQAKTMACLMNGVSFVSRPEFNAVNPAFSFFLDRDNLCKQDLVGFIVNWATVLPLKYFVNRQRPEGYYPRWNSSFPSGHTTFCFTHAVILTHHYPELKVPMYLYATTVGFSRIYLKKHYPTDVIIGAVLGILTGYLTIKLVE